MLSADERKERDDDVARVTEVVKQLREAVEGLLKSSDASWYTGKNGGHDWKEAVDVAEGIIRRRGGCGMNEEKTRGEQTCRAQWDLPCVAHPICEATKAELTRLQKEIRAKDSIIEEVCNERDAALSAKEKAEGENCRMKASLEHITYLTFAHDCHDHAREALSSSSPCTCAEEVKRLKEALEWLKEKGYCLSRIRDGFGVLACHISSSHSIIAEGETLVDVIDAARRTEGG